MTTTITATAIPTGGAILLDFTLKGVTTPGSPMTLSRIDAAGALTVIYTGPAQALFIDVGDALPRPLAAGATYTYAVQDPTGTVTSSPVTAGGAIIFEPDGLTALLIRLLQGGVANLTLPEGVAAALPPNAPGPTVSSAMPITGFPTLPFIVVNLDLEQQEAVPIGQNVTQPDGDNIWTIASHARRMWRVSVLTRTAPERDFYRDALVAIVNSLFGSVFQPLGANLTHRYQAASGQTSDEYQGKSPGFYFADVLVDVAGVFNTSIQTSFGLIGFIDVKTTLPEGAVQEAFISGSDSLPVSDGTSNISDGSNAIYD